MASRHGCSDYLVVQVSRMWTFRLNCYLLTLHLVSFLVKDAQQDIAGDRLKA